MAAAAAEGEGVRGGSSLRCPSLSFFKSAEIQAAVGVVEGSHLEQLEGASGGSDGVL